MASSVATIEDVPNFVAALPLLARADSDDVVFRGHASSAWPLCPSLFRGENGIPLDRRARRRKLNRLAGCVNEFISEYERVLDPRHDVAALPFRDKVALAQHYGVPTPLLDWTDSSLVALFMAAAFWNRKDAAIRIYYALRSEFTTENKAVLFDPARHDPRQKEQKGLLSYCAIDGDGQEAQWLPDYMDEVTDAGRCFKGDLRALDILMDQVQHAHLMSFLDRNRLSFQALFPDSLQWSVTQLVRRHFHE
ncbi:MAG: FRG domain-containing protein [Micropepsaceae bacterium]